MQRKMKMNQEREKKKWDESKSCSQWRWKAEKKPLEDVLILVLLRFVLKFIFTTSLIHSNFTFIVSDISVQGSW